MLIWMFLVYIDVHIHKYIYMYIYCIHIIHPNTKIFHLFYYLVSNKLLIQHDELYVEFAHTN